MNFLHHSLDLIGPYVAAYGPAALFLIIYLESLGMPLPGESALVAAGVLAAAGDVSIVQVLIGVWAGAVLGDSTGYAIGRFGGRPLLVRFGSLIKLTPDRLARLEALFRQKGTAIVVTARFVVLLRQLNGLIAGSVAMPWRHFLLANAIGGALWSIAWGWGAYVLSEHIHLSR